MRHPSRGFYLGLFLLLCLFAIAPASQSAAAGPLDGLIICLDPGHGGADPGALNQAYNLRESDINLDVAFGLRAKLLEQGAKAVPMTRTTDIELDNSARYTFCNSQEADILISIHTNSVTDPTWDGTMTLYGPRESPALAQTLHEVMYPYLLERAPQGVDLFRDWGLDHFASGVLFKSDMPAAMIEPLFMSHPAEAASLVQPIFGLDATCADYSCRRGQIAQAALLGTLAYFSGGTPPGGTMHVADIALSYTTPRSGYLVSTAVAIQDETGQAVAGAEVTLSLVKPDGKTVVNSAVTDSAGQASFSTRSRSSGQLVATVTAVAHSDYAYDPSANVMTTALIQLP